LFAALRSYQLMHRNYFEELEHAAESFRLQQNWDPYLPPSEESLKTLLIEKYRYTVDEVPS